MYNNNRLKSIQPWNEILGVWLRTPWVLRQPIFRNDLIWEYLLNNNVLDTSGFARNGTATSLTYWSPLVGYNRYCGVFNWTASMFTLPTSTSYDLTTGTWCFWVKLNSATYTYTGLYFNVFDHWDETNWSGNYAGMGINFMTDWVNKFRINVVISNGTWGNNTINTIDTGTSDTNWHFLQVTLTGTTTQIFLDNVLVSTKANHSSVNYSTNPVIYIWCNRREYWATNTNFFPWQMALIRIYSILLSWKEKLILYNEWRKLLH